MRWAARALFVWRMRADRRWWGIVKRMRWATSVLFMCGVCTQVMVEVTSGMGQGNLTFQCADVRVVEGATCAANLALSLPIMVGAAASVSRPLLLLPCQGRCCNLHLRAIAAVFCLCLSDKEGMMPVCAFCSN